MPPPAPTTAATPITSIEAHAAGINYPKPVVIQVQGHSTSSSVKQVNINKAAAGVKKTAVAPSCGGIRQHIQAKKKEVKTRASPLDDPIILVQNLPDLEGTEDLEALPSLHEDTTILPAEKKETSESTPIIHPWPVPAADNFEFERMVLQLRSVVESANDDNEALQDSEGEDSDNDESRAPDRVDDASAPPPYTTSKAELLDTAVLEQETFRRALSELLAHRDDPARRAEALASVAPAHHASLLWMHGYIAKLSTNASGAQAVL